MQSLSERRSCRTVRPLRGCRVRGGLCSTRPTANCSGVRVSEASRGAAVSSHSTVITPWWWLTCLSTATVSAEAARFLPLCSPRPPRPPLPLLLLPPPQLVSELLSRGMSCQGLLDSDACAASPECDAAESISRPSLCLCLSPLSRSPSLGADIKDQRPQPGCSDRMKYFLLERRE